MSTRKVSEMYTCDTCGHVLPVPGGEAVIVDLAPGLELRVEIHYQAPDPSVGVSEDCYVESWDLLVRGERVDVPDWLSDAICDAIDAGKIPEVRQELAGEEDAA